jgi:hypothetical protein
MAYNDAVVVVASAARTTNGASAAIPTEKGSGMAIMVEATALSGTPNLVITIDWSFDGTNFAPSDPVESAFTAITTAAPTRAVKQFSTKAPFFRVNWAITGGTPNITFAVWRYTTNAT